MKSPALALATVLLIGCAVIAPASVASAADQAVTGVVTLDGAAASSVEVGWFDPASGASGETTTGADGSYSLVVASGHSYVLYAGIDHTTKKLGDKQLTQWQPTGGTNYVGVYAGVGATDYLYQTLTPFPALTGDLAAQNLALAHPGTIAGAVPGLAKARFYAETLVGRQVGDAKADAAGAYSIAGLIPGRYRVTASFDDARFLPYQSEIITVAAGATVTPATPTLVDNGTISGVVTSHDKPVPHVSVQAADSDGAFGGDRTDAKGRYEITGLAKATYKVAVNIGAEGYDANNAWVEKTTKVTLDQGENKHLDVALRLGGTVTGSVDATKGASKFTVSVATAAGTLVGGLNFDPKKSGRATTFTLKGIKAGTYTARFTDSTQKYYATKKIVVRSGATTKTGTTKLTKKTVTLHGTVTGSPTGTVPTSQRATVVYLPDAYYGSAYTTAKADGSYTLTGLLPGSGIVSTFQTAHGTKDAKLTVTTSKRKTLSLAPALGTLAGTFRADGYPLQSSNGTTLIGTEFAGNFDVDNGVVTGSSKPGSAVLELTQINVGDYEFVKNAPFWVTIPAAKATVAFTSGATTDVGVVDLTVER